MDEYTPSTEEVLDGYRAMRARELPGDRLWASLQASEEASRWLAEHDRQVAEKAWDECWNRIMLTDSEVEAVNPYRFTESEEKE